VNQSEQRAFRAVHGHLRNAEGDSAAFVLTNLTHGNPHGQADEIDMVVVGPGGAIVIEVKHWDGAAIRRVPEMDQHAALITAKAKRIAGRLKSVDPTLGFVPPAMLFTRESGSLRRNGRQAEHLGVRIFSLKDLNWLLADTASRGTTPVEQLARALAPSQMSVEGQPQRFARFDRLKSLAPEDEDFVRVYSARDTERGDRVLLYIYDLSTAPATERSDLTLRRARREFDVVLRFQKSPYLPSLVDSWQALPNYADEVYFFSLAESSAPSVETLRDDAGWSLAQRVSFASRALRALSELQLTGEEGDEPLIHRTINPRHVRVRANNTPLFAGWRWARLPASNTIAPDSVAIQDPYAAPEVQSGGLAAAVPASDVYSLCAVLRELFGAGRSEDGEFRDVLALGLDEDPAKRWSAFSIAEQIDSSQGVEASASVPAPPPASRWDEGHVLEWHGERYRVVSLLGQGGAGRTFKLEQLDASGDPIGTFVGKAVFNPAIGDVSLKAYKKARSFAPHTSLSDVLQTSVVWHPDELMAMLRWTRGEPLDSWRGEIPFLAENAGEANAEALLLRWFGDLCAALDVFHSQGWVHGDVSPSNILVDEDRVVLIDYDLSCEVGTLARSPGTTIYCSPERRAGAPAQPSDDVYALAKTLFHAATGRAPITSETEGGLRWTAEQRAEFSTLAALLDIAVVPSPYQRFENAAAALRRWRAETSPTHRGALLPESPIEPLRPNVVARVKDVLCAYPGSRFGNTETRGLDTAFASDTYVETDLDRTLLEAVRSGVVSLVILCGNAGDGKTAFLQHLAEQLGAGSLPSSQRVWNGMLGARKVMINLDGAASWNGRSADALLDELFARFQNGSPQGYTHLVAVNDGRLLEWIEYSLAVRGETPLTQQLASALVQQDGTILDSHIRFIELNRRSLVGGLNPDGNRITADFVDDMIARLVGGEQSAEIWGPCQTCTARVRCPMWASAAMMGASTDPHELEKGRRFRERLTAALQAVHQRNEVHITARELKAAMSYILFGLYSCEDLHAQPDLRLHHPADHAFDPESPMRQGELLRELARLDPGLEAHARVDRYLSGRGAPDPAHGAPRFRDEQGRPLPLRQARRRAYFTWSADQIEAAGGASDALGLKDSRHYARFRDFPLLPADDREEIKRRLCEGLSRLEALPDAAFRRGGSVPIRIVPRTPTETAFWVGKPLERFGLEAERFNAADGLTTLHRFLILSYRPHAGPTERLVVPLELFALLMDLADGVQIMDAFSDDVFANLGVFTQRLAQEDERSVLAWTPADESRVFVISIEERDAGQTIVLTAEGA
jgi:serine/threonine protein kinase